ncbi:hypothetical protein [Methylobacterium sp. A54F]
MARTASILYLFALTIGLSDARAQSVDDGSDRIIGQAATRTVIALIARHLNSPDAKITALRRSTGSFVCGSVNVKNRDDLYSGERGFVIDLSDASFGRVPDGPELLTFRPGEAYQEMERVRQLYFKICLD